MTVLNLRQAFGKNRGALVGLGCLGWEEVRAFVAAAEETELPAVLMVGPGARKSMPLRIWGPMLLRVAESSGADLVVHLDHGRSLEEVREALDAGFSSVMFDGSGLPLAENVSSTRQMVELAQDYNASTEGEIGFVGYAEGAASVGTDPEEAAAFARETGVDCMAVSVGNSHLQTEASAEIDWPRLARLAGAGTPLVIHGGSGVRPADRKRMWRDYRVRKFNIGTEIRQVFGASLRSYMSCNPDEFDHLRILESIHIPVCKAVSALIRELGGNAAPC